MCLAVCNALGATTFSVSNLNDSGAGSLRQAITDAEAAAGADDIEFGAALNGSIDLQTALPDITQSLTLQGPTLPTSQVTIARAATAPTNFRILTIVSGTMEITNLTFSAGSVRGNPARGGGINNAGTLLMTDCAVVDCAATGDDDAGGGLSAEGGGIFNSGTLTLTDCEIMGCEAHGGAATVMGGGGAAEGGGIATNGGQLTMVFCHIEHCHANGGEGLGGSNGLGTGAGVSIIASVTSIRDCNLHGCESRSHHAPNQSGATISQAGSTTILRTSVVESVGVGMFVLAAATLRNMTFSGNMGGDCGGVLVGTASAVSIEYCTITGNSGTLAGGLRVISGTPAIEGCIIAGNTGTAPDVEGTINDGGFNLVGDATGSTGFTTSTLVGSGFSPISAGLGPLKHFGMHTMGHEPAFGSFAINSGGAGAPIDDQRGANRALGGTPDIGSVEFIANNAPSFTNGGTVSVSGDSPRTIAAWAGSISPGATWEHGQMLSFSIVGPTGAFSSGPSINTMTGDLSFRPRKGSSGTYVFDVYLTDDGGTAGGGSDTSPLGLLFITVSDNNDDNEDELCSTAAGGSPWLLLGSLMAAMLVALRLKRTRA